MPSCASFDVGGCSDAAKASWATYQRTQPCRPEDARNACPSQEVNVAPGQRRYCDLRAHPRNACHLDWYRNVIGAGVVGVEARRLHRDADL
jgi:hypothetical protein